MIIVDHLTDYFELRSGTMIVLPINHADSITCECLIAINYSKYPNRNNRLPVKVYHAEKISDKLNPYR